jgi:hypothetical protein
MPPRREVPAVTTMFRDVSRDLGFTVRSLTRAPGYAVGVMGSLTLGIVANIAAFSFINAVVFRPFPGVRNQHELVEVHVQRAERFGTVNSSSYQEYLTLRGALPALDDLAAQLRVQLQSALSLGLLATGAQFVHTVRTDFGRPDAPGAERLLIASFDVEPLNMQRAAADDFYARLLDRAASLPGVVAAGFASAGPVADAFNRDSAIRVWLEQDAPAEGRDSVAALVSGDYFRATGTPLVQGRGFAEADRNGSIRTAIVSQAFARRFLGPRAIGRSLRVAVEGGPYESRVEVLVVGVVGPAVGERGTGLPLLYYSTPVVNVPARSLYVSFDQSGQFTLPALQKAVRDVDYRVPIRDAVTLRQRRDATGQEDRLLANGVAALGIFALVLAAGGLYGVVSYLVTLRRRELGIRLALGASPSSVVALVVRQGLMPAAIGTIIGAGGAIAIGLVVRSRLHGVSAVDPTAFAAAAALLFVTMIIAALVPARYAASFDPAAILRED